MNKKTLQELISNCHAAGKKTAVSFSSLFEPNYSIKKYQNKYKNCFLHNDALNCFACKATNATLLYL